MKQQQQMKMDDELPRSYDVIVIGTGMPECMLAAAVARIGKTVLHLDRNDYYGGDWSSFNFDQLQNWIQNNKETCVEQIASDRMEESISQEERIIYLNRSASNISNLHEISNIRESEDVSEAELDENSHIHNLNEVQASDIQQSNSQDEGSQLEDQNLQQVLGEPDNPNEISEHPAVEEQVVHNREENSEGETAFSGENNNEENSSAASPELANENRTSNSSNKLRKKWTLSMLRSQYRKFNLDLAPKLLFSRGSLVELLISSNIARYAEFKSITRILTLLEGKLKEVPASRADVFNAKDVGIVEKRMLMKFLTFCFEYHKNPESYRGYEGRPFVEFLKSWKLTPSLKHYILHAIAMVDEETPTLQGLKAMQHFLESLGRYGNSPFLWSLYGSAELPQCFCRLCAVFGGIYHLKRKAEALILNSEGRCKGIISNNQRMDSTWIVMESSYAANIEDSYSSLTSLLPENFQPGRISRGIFITDSSILPAEHNQITLLRLPPENGITSTITVLELGPGAMVCPSHTYVVHFTCQSVAENAEDDLMPAARLLFQSIDKENNELAIGDSNDSKPKILWCVFFNMTDTTTTDLNITYPQGIVLTSTPGSQLDYEHSVKEAKKLFQKMFPEEEFLPRAPDPEEISLEPCNHNPGEENVSNLEHQICEEVSSKDNIEYCETTISKDNTELKTEHVQDIIENSKSEIVNSE